MTVMILLPVLGYKDDKSKEEFMDKITYMVRTISGRFNSLADSKNAKSRMYLQNRVIICPLVLSREGIAPRDYLRMTVGLNVQLAKKITAMLKEKKFDTNLCSMVTLTHCWRKAINERIPNSKGLLCLREVLWTDVGNEFIDLGEEKNNLISQLIITQGGDIQYFFYDMAIDAGHLKQKEALVNYNKLTVNVDDKIKILRYPKLKVKDPLPYADIIETNDDEVIDIDAWEAEQEQPGTSREIVRVDNLQQVREESRSQAELVALQQKVETMEATFMKRTNDVSAGIIANSTLVATNAAKIAAIEASNQDLVNVAAEVKTTLGNLDVRTNCEIKGNYDEVMKQMKTLRETYNAEENSNYKMIMQNKFDEITADVKECKKEMTKWDERLTECDKLLREFEKLRKDLKDMTKETTVDKESVIVESATKEEIEKRQRDALEERMKGKGETDKSGKRRKLN